MSHIPLFDDGRWAVDLGGVHVEFGAGGLDRLGEAARGLVAEGSRVLVVTDPGLVAAGHVERALDALDAAGLQAAVFDGARENPTTEDVDRGVAAARSHDLDVTGGLLVALGGGSAMDCCKGINFLLSQGGSMEDYWGVDKATQPMFPSIGVPTTGGTGSEAQRFALISRASDHRKMACGDRKARFRTVLLDPDLLATVPRSVAAVTGLDAVSHAIETYVTRRRNPVSQVFARDAWRRLERSLEDYLADPANSRARADVLVGAHFAGAAIEASMLGAAHACANPLTARYGVVHGLAVGIMLPHVVRFNGEAVGELYAELASSVDALVDRLEAILAAAGQGTRLADQGIERHLLPTLAEEAAEQWTGKFNPREVRAEDLQGLYASAF